MAVTKTHPIKSTLKAAIDYICDPAKMDGKRRGNVENGRSTDGKQHSRPNGKASGFPTARKHRFPQVRPSGRLRTFPQRLRLRISFLSCPVLIEKEKKEHKKEAGALPSAWTECGAPALLWESVQNGPFPPPKRRREGGMGNHKGGSRKSRHRRFFSLFSTLIPTLFRACGQVMGTGDERCPEALLAGMDTAFADLVVLAADVLPQEEGPFQPPLLASAHRSSNPQGLLPHLLQDLRQGLLVQVRRHLARLHREGERALGDFFLHSRHLRSSPPYRSWLTRDV